MPAQLSILVGPARSGKTSRLLADYRQALAVGPPGCALWLGPNRWGVATVLEQLLDERLTHCASPQCMTFGQFAQQVLDCSPAPLRPLSELMKRQLLRGLIARGTAEGKLVHFAPIADTPGLLQLVSQTIREWKRLEIWPYELAAACAPTGLTEKDAELLWLYEDYQRLLNEHSLYDAEGRFWSARERLRKGQRRPFERVTQVFVDGFTDFTRTEHEILAILAERVEQIVVTLPLESGVRGQESELAASLATRSELFAKPLRTLRELQRRHPAARVEALARRPTDWPAMDHIEANLFQSPNKVHPLKGVAGVEIVAAAGQLNEIEGIARQIKLLLEPESGIRGQETRAERIVRPHDILVVFRSLGDAAPLVREVFDRFGIPLAIETYAAISDAACVSSLVAWLRLAVDDWPFRQLLTMLSHNSFHPSWPEWKDGHAAVAAEQLIRELQLPSGRMELIRRLTRLAAIPKQGEPTPPVGSRSERRIERARLAAPLLEKLSQMLTALPTTATPTEWSRALAKLSNALGLSRIIVDSPSEKAAWDRLMKSLRSMDRLTEWTQSNQHAPRAVADSKGTVPISQSDGTRSVPATLRELLDCIIEIAQCETLPPEHDEVGRVCIVGASSARPLSVPYVFFAGLTEKAFPAAEREDRVYSEAEIVRLAEAGLPLTTRAQRSQEEMLLFYEVATRATHQLVMSYAGLDAKAQPLSPSPYLVELERACGDGKIPHHVDLHLSPVPREQEILCERDLRVRAVADALDGNRKLLAGMVPQQGSGVRDQESGIQDQKARAKREHAASSLLTALHTIHDRSRGSEFGPFEGVFSSDAARAKLMERFGPDRCWSPSQLEKYAYCPFQFFSERIMRLEPLGDLALEVDYLLRGKLLHSTLTKVHRDLKDASGNLVSPSVQSAEAFETAARAVLGSILEMLCTDNLTAESLREVDRRVLAEWLSNYYTQHQDYDALWSEFESPLRPAHFEVAFGPLHEEADSEPEEVPVDCDILATSKPLELKQGDQTVRLRGRIDRVDLGQIAGRTVFNVIDYKSASDVKLSGETVAAGLTLQLPLYALAVEQLLLADREAIPWRASYWLVKEKGFRHRSALAFYQLVDGRLEPDDAWVNLRDQLLSRVVSLVRGVREGAFPMHCADDKCTGRCPYHTVCRVGQVRALEKTWQPPVAVV